MKVVVVGGGIFAQVVTWRLAARNVDVVQLEAVEPAHAASQSGDRSRVVRSLYGDRSFATSGHRSLAMWQSWSEELGVRLVELCGVLYIERDEGTPDDAAFTKYVDDGIVNLVGLGVSLSVLTPSTLGEMYPAISTQGVTRAVLEPNAGFGRVALATQTIARAAKDTGKVELLRGRVKRIVTEGGAARGVVADVDGDERTFDADAVVVAAGLGGAELVEAMNGKSLGIRPIPHFVSYWDLREQDAPLFRMDRLPVWAELGARRYGFPDDGEAGFKAAWHEPLRTDDRRAEPTTEVVEELKSELAVRFPALARATLRGTWPCTYDATPDENFQIGWVPDVKGAYLVGGLSGHGFKHAPAIGDSVAAVVAGQQPALDLKPYALRFSS